MLAINPYGPESIAILTSLPYLVALVAAALLAAAFAAGWFCGRR